MVHDLPGVGENLQDHCGGRIIYRCAPGVCTMNEIYHNWLRRIQHGLQYVLAMKGALMTGAGPMGLFVRTRPELASPDVQYQFLAGSSEKTGDAMHRFPGCTLVAIPCRPESRGWLRITSPDPAKPPAIQPNYLATQADKDTMVAGLKVSRRIFATAAMRQVRHRGIPARPAGDVGRGPAEPRARDRRHDVPPDQHLHDGAGPMAVVDASLRVKGMERLRVIDASIMPTVVSGNTNATAIMIGEKGADMILRAA